LTKTAQKSTPTADAKTFAIEAAKLAAATRCHSVVVLDVRGLSPMADFLVLATGTSDRQMRGVGNEIEELGDGVGQHVVHRSSNETWILLDYVDVVVHLFEHETRMFYDLDSLWGDAPRVTWKD
jgi:ribosome-associated protein